MSFLLSLALTFSVVPQGSPTAQDGAQASAKAPLLAVTEQASLRDKLAKFLADDAVYVRSTGKERDKASRSRDKSKEAFDDEWKKGEKKGNLIASTADLRAVFENCFLLKQPSFSVGQLRKDVIKEEQLEYHFFLPKTYKATTPHRTVLVVPGSATADGVGTWAKAIEYFTATWEKSPTANDSIFHVCSVPTGLELDPIPDYSRTGADEEEKRRNTAVFKTFGEVMFGYNVDRARVFLDCGRSACGYGVRLMTLFPDRFAGAILRAPTQVDDLRLGSLAGIPVLLLRTAASAAAVDALKQRLDEVSPNTTTVLEAADEYPHRGSTPAIEEWMKGKKRNMVPSKIVLEPNHDIFNRAYWADIDVADSLLTVQPDKKPRLEVVADRAANRITVKTVGVERFSLYLNDDLVDLDKEFTVVINDKAVTEKKVRSFRGLLDRVIVRNDWDYLFPVQFSTAVPKQ